MAIKKPFPGVMDRIADGMIIMAKQLTHVAIMTEPNASAAITPPYTQVTQGIDISQDRLEVDTYPCPECNSCEEFDLCCEFGSCHKKE